MSRTGSHRSALLFALGIGSSLSIGLGLGVCTAHADAETGSAPTNPTVRGSAAAHRSAPVQGAQPRTAPLAASAKASSATPAQLSAAAGRVSTRSPSTRIAAVALPAQPRPAAPPANPGGDVEVNLTGVTSLLGSAPVPPSATSRVATQAAVAATAATPDVTVEAESLVLTPSRAGRVYADTSAAGGSALLMSTNGSSSTTLTLPAFTSLVIRARGDQYRGAPKMTVSVDGVVVSTTSVSATSWTDYVIPVAGAAGSHTLSVAYTNDLRASGSKDRNLRLDKITVIAAAAPVNPSDLFPAADWLNKPIEANPALAADSATWVGYFSAPGTQRVANLYQYSVALVSGSTVTSSTPRYDITFTQPWGSDPFAGFSIPIPRGTPIPAGSDAPLAVQDPLTGQVFGLWQAKYNSTADTWTASWGGMTPIGGDGIDTSGSATATNISRYAGVVTGAEFTAAIAANTGLSHALVFSTDIAGATFVGPATKSDGLNAGNVALPIPEGYRVQLDPSINVDAIAGMTPGERVIAKTLQTYGAYVIDRGGARMAFNFELQPDATSTNPGKAYTDAGFGWDYFDMARIPWSNLRVLAV